MAILEQPTVGAADDEDVFDILIQPSREVKVPWYHAVYIVWYRDVIRYSRDRMRLAASFAQPILFLALFGVGFSSALGATGFKQANVSYVQFMYPGIICMTVLFTSMFSAMSVVWDREFGFLREMLVAPIGRSWVAMGKALGGATQAMIQGTLMLALAPLVGVTLTPLSVAITIPLLFVLAFSLTGLGVAMAARMKSMQGFQVIMNFLIMPMFFLSGALFPLSHLPSWMTVLTRLDPVTYGVAPVRAVALTASGAPPSTVTSLTKITIGSWILPAAAEVGILLAFGICTLMISMAAFRKRD